MKAVALLRAGATAYVLNLPDREPPAVYSGQPLPSYVYATYEDALRVALAWNERLAQSKTRMLPFTVQAVTVQPGRVVVRLPLFGGAGDY